MGRLRPFRFSITVAAGAAAAVLAAAPALAATTVPLHPDHVGKKAAAFQQECDDEFFANKPAGFDAWHFVLPGGNSAFTALHLTFNNTMTINVTAGVTGPNGSFIRADKPMHAYVFTPAGWTLTAGTAEITGTATKFNVSHTCAGKPSQSPSQPGSPPPPSGSPGPSASAGPSMSPSNGGASPPPNGGLPITGTAVGGIVVVGLGLLGAGAALTVAARRRRDVTP